MSILAIYDIFVVFDYFWAMLRCSFIRYQKIIINEEEKVGIVRLFF